MTEAKANIKHGGAEHGVRFHVYQIFLADLMENI